MTVGVIPSGRLADCVEEFIRHIPRGEVMSVNRIVTKGESVFGEGILKSAKNTVVKSELPLSVVNEDGRITGTISKNKLISVLFGLED
jgi:ABC-type proline/glycine betaine transport system ATPase subunit